MASQGHVRQASRLQVNMINIRSSKKRPTFGWRLYFRFPVGFGLSAPSPFEGGEGLSSISKCSSTEEN